MSILLAVDKSKAALSFNGLFFCFRSTIIDFLLKSICNKKTGKNSNVFEVNLNPLETEEPQTLNLTLKYIYCNGSGPVLLLCHTFIIVKHVSLQAVSDYQ